MLQRHNVYILCDCATCYVLLIHNIILYSISYILKTLTATIDINYIPMYLHSIVVIVTIQLVI